MVGCNCLEKIIADLLKWRQSEIICQHLNLDSEVSDTYNSQRFTARVFKED